MQSDAFLPGSPRAHGLCVPISKPQAPSAQVCGECSRATLLTCPVLATHELTGGSGRIHTTKASPHVAALGGENVSLLRVLWKMRWRADCSHLGTARGCTSLTVQVPSALPAMAGEACTVVLSGNRGRGLWGQRRDSESALSEEDSCEAAPGPQPLSFCVS